MLVVLCCEPAVDVRQADVDAVLVPLKGLQVDRVGEVRGEELVALVLEALPVRGQLGQFFGVRGEGYGSAARILGLRRAERTGAGVAAVAA